MISENSEKLPTASNLTTSKNTSMESSTKNSRIVMRLLADAKNLLRDSYSDEEFKQTFTIIKTAKSRGFLGPHKLSDCCLAEAVNIANDILRDRKFDGAVIDIITRRPEAIYVYVSLVAIGLIPA